VDGANVVGSVPDGWWRDRHGATERLRDALVAVAEEGLPPCSGAPEWARHGPLEVLLVVEGQARGVATVPSVRVAVAAGSGDDLIVSLLAAERAADDGRPPRRCLVVTADRDLRARVAALGACVVGPRAVRRR
jgi:hypothetical protein